MWNHKRILISRTDAIGDVVLTLPMAGVLKSVYPHCRITFLARRYTRPIIACSQHVDDIVVWDDYLDGQSVAPLEADVILHVFPDHRIATFAQSSGIPLRIGTWRRFYHLTTCNHFVNLARRSSTLHEAQLNLKLLAPLNAPSELILDRIPDYYGLTRLPTLPASIASLLDPHKTKVILHPKSRGHGREWGLDHFRALIDRLPSDRFQILISGTKLDAENMRSFLDSLPKHVLNMTDRLSLDELIALISKTDALVASGTGPLHMAAALGKKAIGLFPPIHPMHPERWCPLGSKAHTLVTDKPNCRDCENGGECACMRRISPDDVAHHLL